MKTMETTEEVSLRAVEKREERNKKHGNTPSAREKPKTTWQNGLQVCGEGSGPESPAVGGCPEGVGWGQQGALVAKHQKKVVKPQ
jgi:hypothetical protein